MTLAVLILATLFGLLFARLKFTIYQHRRKSAESIWMPILRSLRSDSARNVGPIKPIHRDIVLELWVGLRIAANPTFAAHLDLFAAQHKLDKTISATLKPNTFALLGKPIWLQSIALTGVQWLHSPDVLKFTHLILDSGNRYIAVNACAALAKLKARGYERALIKILMRFPEEAPYITSHIGAAGGSDILHILKPFLDKLPKYAVMNFIALAETSNDPSLLPLVGERLASSRNTEETAALLRTIGRLGGPEQRSMIYPHLNSQETPVKIQAVKSLGKIGDATDIALLIPSLASPDWWLRYRAAKAIILLSDNDEARIRELITNNKDAFAADILRHAWSEHEWLLT